MELRMDAAKSPSTIADVAQLAGVSITTVSHVTSGNRPVGSSTTRRVREAMRQLRYIPNSAARSLALGSAQTLGLVVPDIGNTFFAELAKGASDAADSLGYALLLGNGGSQPEREAHYLDTLRSRAVDGLIYAPGAALPERYLSDLASEFPMAIVDEAVQGLAAIQVLSDNHQGGRLVAELLCGLGHSSFLVITGPPSLPSSSERLSGFVEAVRELCAGPEPELKVVEGTYELRSGFEVVKARLEQGRLSASAVFALNDLMAVGALQALQQAGMSVPHQVSVVGYDDSLLAAGVSPSLSTVRQPAYEMGHTAALELLNWLESGRPPEPLERVLEVGLIVRNSVGITGG